MSYAHRAIRGISAVFLFKIFAIISAYALRLVLARYLGPESYGLFYAVFTLIVFFLFFRNLGVDQALVKFIPEFLVNKNLAKVKAAVISAFILQTCGSLILSAVFWVLGGWLAQNYFNVSESRTLLNVLLLYVILSPLFYVPKKILNGFQKYAHVSAYECVKNALVLFFSLLFIFWGLGIMAPAWAYVISCLALPIVFLVPIKGTGLFKAKSAQIKPIARKLLLFGIPVMATNIGDKIIGYTDTIILTAYSPLSEVGTYNVVLPTAMILLFLGSLSTVLFPMVSELWTKKDLRRIQEGIRLLHTYALTLTIPFIFSIFVYAPLAIKILFGKEYIEGALALQILLVGTLGYLMANINNSIISAVGQPKKVTFVILISATINVILNFLLIPKYGIEGAASATTASYVCALFMSTAIVAKNIKSPFPFGTWGRISFCGLIFVLVVQFIKSHLVLPLILEIMASIGSGIIVYCILLWWANLVSLEELKFYAARTWKKPPEQV